MNVFVRLNQHVSTVHLVVVLVCFVILIPCCCLDLWIRSRKIFDNFYIYLIDFLIE